MRKKEIERNKNCLLTLKWNERKLKWNNLSFSSAAKKLVEKEAKRENEKKERKRKLCYNDTHKLNF